MKYRSTALILVGTFAGAVAGASLGPALTGAEAQSAATKQVKYRGRDMRLKTPRIPPIAAEDFTPEQEAVAVAAGSPNGANDNFRTALHNPELAKAWWDWLRFVHDNLGTRAEAGDALPRIDKELVVMRTNYLNNDDWV